MIFVLNSLYLNVTISSKQIFRLCMVIRELLLYFIINRAWCLQMRMKRKELLIAYIVAIILILVVIIWLLADVFSGKGNDNRDTVINSETETTKSEPEPVKVTVDTDVIKDGLREMQVLTTEEYSFTQVEKYEKTRDIFWFVQAESSFLYSYDGVITAGIDCSKITVDFDESTGVVSVNIPKSEIQAIDIDYDSFRKYEEKESFWNKLDMSDYNDAMKEFEEKARKSALEKGILERADDNANSLISNFVRGLVDTSQYRVEIVSE